MTVLLIAGCGSSPDNDSLETRGERIECALEGAKSFARDCTVTEMGSSDATTLVVGRPDVGYRRLLITNDGRGVVSADGAEPAGVTIIGDDVIEVAVGADRYRLPANTGGTKERVR